LIRVFLRPCGKSHNEEHTAAYELLYAAASLMGLKSGRVEKTADGKPFFSDAPETFFSISHCRGYAVVAVGDEECGVDIEGGREISKGIRQRFLNDASEEEALIRWTERESRGKLFGGGFFDESENGDVKYRHFEYDGFCITVCGKNENGMPEKIEKI
jgi:phosphopantetheinyl transferase